MQKNGNHKIYLIYFFNFFVSMLPLWISILVKYCFKIYYYIENRDVAKITFCQIVTRCQFIFALFVIITFLLSYVSLIKYLNDFNDYMDEIKVFKSVSRGRTLTLGFVITYVLPLFAFNFWQFEGLILFLVYFFTLSILVIKNRVFDGNIVLECMGFNFYKCKIDNSDEICVVSKREIEKNIEYQVKFINQNDVCVAK